ncbi:MAG: hypothetical protein WCP97_09390, partial [bacterium]
FTSLVVENFVAFQQNLNWKHAPLNVIIGENDTGKTHLLTRNRLDPLTTFRDVLLGSAGVPPAAGKMPAFPA